MKLSKLCCSASILKIRGSLMLQVQGKSLWCFLVLFQNLMLQISAVTPQALILDGVSRQGNSSKI